MDKMNYRMVKTWMFLLGVAMMVSSCVDEKVNIRKYLENFQWTVISYSWSSADGTDAGAVEVSAPEDMWLFFDKDGEGVFADMIGEEPSMKDFKWKVENDILSFSMSGHHIDWHVDISGGTSADDRMVLTLRTDDYWGDGSGTSVTVRIRRA